MVYVWLDTTTGTRRFVNDIHLNRCDKCGKTVSECRLADCWQNPYELTPPPAKQPTNKEFPKWESTTTTGITTKAPQSQKKNSTKTKKS